VLAAEGAEVVDERLEGLGQVEHLAPSVDLHVRAVPVVGEHHEADPRVAARVGDLRPLRVGGDDEAALTVDAARHRRGLQAAVGAGRRQHDVVPLAAEVEQAGQVGP
jgi:hypothetical protein